MKTPNIHAQVREIMLQSRAERWARTSEQEALLQGHVAECRECAQQQLAIEASLLEVQAVSASIAASATLVRSTQLRVRARAQELKKQKEFMLPLWMAAMLAFLWAGAAMPFLWQGFRWLGQNSNLPDAMWISGFVIMCLTPAAAVGTIALTRSQKPASTA